MKSVGQIEKLYADYKDKAHIYLMYIREAHPIDGRMKPSKDFPIADPKTLEERRKAAKDFAAKLKVTLPILIDTLDDRVDKAYAGWPDRIYVIDAEGKVAFKGDVGPGGFIPAVKATPAVLEKLLLPR